MKKDPYKSRKNLILSCMLTVPFIPFAIVLWISYYYFAGSLESGTKFMMTRMLEDHSLMIENFLEERLADLRFIAKTNSLESLSEKGRISEIFNYIQDGSNAFYDIGVFNLDGVHIAYHGPYELRGKNYKDSEWFKEVMKKGEHISDIFMGFRNTPHFIIAIRKGDKDSSWVIRATINTHIFNNMVENVRMGKTGESYILNSAGIFQTKPTHIGSIMEQDNFFPKYPEIGKGIKIFSLSNSAGEKYLYAAKKINENRWFIVVRQQEKDAFATLRTASSRVLFTAVIGGLIIIMLAYYLTEKIMRQLRSLDIEKRQLNDHLIRAARLAELGEMAAGFAHEINNPLQIINNENTLIEMVISDLKEKGELKNSEDLSEIEGSLEQIKKQIKRGAKITSAILKFGRQSKPLLENIYLNEFLLSMIDLVSKKADLKSIEIKKDIPEQSVNVTVDSGQLQQVIINLLNNAIDALAEKNGGLSREIEISLLADTKEEAAQISIKDNGVGIPKENIEKIFSPFFTTKPIGKGTGLGLSVCYGIIKSLGGSMNFNSEQGRGTTFNIFLPLTPKN